MTKEEFTTVMLPFIPDFDLDGYECLRYLDYSKGTLLEDNTVDISTIVLGETRSPIGLASWPRRVKFVEDTDNGIHTVRESRGVVTTEYNFSVVDGKIIMEMVSLSGVYRHVEVLVAQGYSEEDAQIASRNLKRREYIFTSRVIPSFRDNLEVDFKVEMSEDGSFVNFLNQSTVGGVPWRQFNSELHSFVELRPQDTPERSGYPLFVADINIAANEVSVPTESLSIDYGKKAFRYVPQILVEQETILEGNFVLVDRAKGERVEQKFLLPLTQDGFGDLVVL
jgi:hypothetical protein